MHLRTARPALACLTALLAVAACSSSADPGDEAAGPTSAGSTAPAAVETSSAPAYDGPTIPDGDYRRVLDDAAKRQAGVTLSNAALEWGPDGTMTNTLRFRGDQWAQVADYGDGAPTVGASGTISYDQRGRLLVDEPCCGRSRFTWDLDGDELTMALDLDFLEAEHPGLDRRSQDVRVGVLMTSGTYTRVG